MDKTNEKLNTHISRKDEIDDLDTEYAGLYTETPESIIEYARSAKFVKKREKIFYGILGAIAFSIPAAAIAFLLYTFSSFLTFFYLAIPPAAYSGYRIFSRWEQSNYRTKRRFIIPIMVSAIMTIIWRWFTMIYTAYETTVAKPIFSNYTFFDVFRTTAWDALLSGSCIGIGLAYAAIAIVMWYAVGEVVKAFVRQNRRDAL